MRDRIERRKRIRKIGALVVLGIFVATMLPPSAVAQDQDWAGIGTGDLYLFTNSDDVGIGTTSPSHKLEISDSDTTANRAGLRVAQTGAITETGYGIYVTKTGASTTNVAGYFSATQGTNNYGLIVENGKVGIGTADPGARLEVKPIVTDTADYMGIKSGIIYDGASPMISWYGTYIATPSGTGSILSKYALVTEANAGNVGIGTTSPQQKLTLGSGSNFATEMPAPGKPSATVYLSGGMIEDGTYYYVITALDGFGQTVKGIESDAVKVLGGSGYASVELTWTAVTGAVSYKVYRTTTPGDYSSPAYIGASVTNEYTDVKKDPSNGEPPSSTTAYVNKITSSGNSWFLGGKIGIGTNNPGVTLHVMSGVEEHIRVQKKGQNPYMDITSGGAWCGLELHNTLVELFSIWEGDWDTGQNRFHIRNGGNIGIGTMTPDKKLEIQDDTDAQLRLSNADAFYTDLQTTSSGHLYINPSGGRVGIGEASPGSELDVAGTITGDGLVIDGTVSGTGFNGWDRDDSDDLTTSTGFDGDVSGTYNDLQLRPEVVGSDELASSGVTAGTYGSATQVAQILVDGDGRITSAVNVNIDISGSETDPQVDDSQTTNYVPKWDGSALVTGTMYDNGNIGIGDTDPDCKLEIRSTYANQFRISYDADDRFDIGVGPSGQVDFITVDSDGNSGDIRLLPDGNVGIGALSPDRPLEIFSNTKVPQFRITYSDAYDYADFAVDADGQLDITTADGGGTGGHICLMPDGNVGIGTLIPNHKLEIIDSDWTANRAGLYLSQSGATNYAGDIIYGIYVTKTGGGPGTNVAGYFSASGAAGNNYGLIVENGRVGIGILEPEASLHVNGGVIINDDIRVKGDDILDAGGTRRITFVDNGNLYLREDSGCISLSIDTAGKVGIGDSDPNEQLDVNGKLHMRDNIKLNSNWLSGDGGNEGVYVTNDGKIGIGTNDPKTDLHIDGDGILGLTPDNRHPSGSSGVCKLYVDIDYMLAPPRTTYKLMFMTPEGTSEVVHEITEW